MNQIYNVAQTNKQYVNFYFNLIKKENIPYNVSVIIDYDSGIDVDFSNYENPFSHKIFFGNINDIEILIMDVTKFINKTFYKILRSEKLNRVLNDYK